MWTIHQLCVLQAIIEKGENPSRKEAKREQNSNLCRDTKFKQAQGTMSLPAYLCRSKDWSELKTEKSFLGRDRKVLCRDRT